MTEFLANIWVREKIDQCIENWGDESVYEEFYISDTVKLLENIEGCDSLYEIIRRVKLDDLAYVFTLYSFD